MGSSSSKVARSATRKYPTRTPAPATSAGRPRPANARQQAAPPSSAAPSGNAPGPTVHPNTKPRSTRDEGSL
ncbi:hypothetical protein B7463_g10760, partial [Scytalidium lignicola]